MTREKGFTISIEGTHYLTVEEIWPDGDAPENPTTADVKAVMEACGSKSRVLKDWCLDFDVYVEHERVWK